MKLNRCDHCKRDLFSPMQISEITVGGRQLDLCQDCFRRLDEWLKGKAAPALEKPTDKSN